MGSKRKATDDGGGKAAVRQKASDAPEYVKELKMTCSAIADPYLDSASKW
jgi:hypothetical protein